MTHIVICVTGRARAGKDVAGKYLQNHHGFTIEKFAQPLKEVMNSLFGYTIEFLESDAKDAIDPVYGVSPRQLMQCIGTDLLQHELSHKLSPGGWNLGRGIFANRLCQRLEVLAGQGKNKIVVTDMRFMHEYQVLKQWCNRNHYTFQVWQVVRDQSPFISQSGHESEQGWQAIPHDQVILNNSSLVDFENCVRNNLTMMS